MDQPVKRKRGRPRKNPVAAMPDPPLTKPAMKEPVTAEPMIPSSPPIIKELPTAPESEPQAGSFVAVPFEAIPEVVEKPHIEKNTIDKEETVVNETLVHLPQQTYQAIEQLRKLLSLETIEETIWVIASDTLTNQLEKTIVPERDPEIKEFFALCQRLQTVYKYSLVMYQDAEFRAYEEVKHLLDSKDKTISDLQLVLQQREEEFEAMAKALSLAERERDAATAETETFRMAGRTDIAVTRKLEDFQKQLNKIVAQVKNR